MASSKEVRNQIASIGNTQKITSAMEKVAASKMKKTEARMAKGRSYRERMLEVISHLANGQPEYKPTFMQERDVKNVSIIVVTSDKGLCGGLNSNLFREVTKLTRELSEQGKQVSYCLIGTKGRAFFKSYGGKIVSATEKLGDDPSIEELLAATKVLLDSFVEGKVDQIYLASNKFVNTMTQNPTVDQLVPLVREKTEEKPTHWDYIYEPDDSRLILDSLMSRYIESLVYQAVVENIACEQAAKMVAMKSATDNAGDLIDELELVYNKTRQAAITQELSEIVAGAAAL